MTITKASSIDTDLKQYKLADVALRNGKDGNEVWVVIKDNVYDVTHYMDSHPGGTQLILEFAGKDCTKDFYDAGHSLDSLRDHTYLIIGELVFEDKKCNRGKIQKIADVNSEEMKKKKKKLGGFLFC